MTDRVCRRCDQPESRHVKVDGVGHVCPRAVSTFDPQPENELPVWNEHTFVTPAGIIVTVHERIKVTIYSREGLDAGVWLRQVADEWNATIRPEDPPQCIKTTDSRTGVGLQCRLTRGHPGDHQWVSR